MIRRENVALHFDPDAFTGRFALLAAAAKAMNADLERSAATWEPHDWSDF